MLLICILHEFQTRQLTLIKYTKNPNNAKSSFPVIICFEFLDFINNGKVYVFYDKYVNIYHVSRAHDGAYVIINCMEQSFFF